MILFLILFLLPTEAEASFVDMDSTGLIMDPLLEIIFSRIGFDVNGTKKQKKKKKEE